MLPAAAVFMLCSAASRLEVAATLAVSCIMGVRCMMSRFCYPVTMSGPAAATATQVVELMGDCWYDNQSEDCDRQYSHLRLCWLSRGVLQGSYARAIGCTVW